MERTNTEAQRRSFGFLVGEREDPTCQVSAPVLVQTGPPKAKVAKTLEGGSSRSIARAPEESKRNAIWVDEHRHLVPTWKLLRRYDHLRAQLFRLSDVIFQIFDPNKKLDHAAPLIGRNRPYASADSSFTRC
jgi:hypothetical protein